MGGNTSVKTRLIMYASIRIEPCVTFFSRGSTTPHGLVHVSFPRTESRIPIQVSPTSSIHFERFSLPRAIELLSFLYPRYSSLSKPIRSTFGLFSLLTDNVPAGLELQRSSESAVLGSYQFCVQVCYTLLSVICNALLLTDTM